MNTAERENLSLGVALNALRLWFFDPNASEETLNKLFQRALEDRRAYLAARDK